MALLSVVELTPLVDVKAKEVVSSGGSGRGGVSVLFLRVSAIAADADDSQ